MASFIPNVTDVFPEPSLFTPDFSYMDHMLRRRQAQYDQGFAQVSSKYDFVNRALTNPANEKSRDVFLKQAKDNLKNLSGMDLSEAQNVESAKSVFEPWVNNTNALWDATLTDHWNKQEQMADGFRHQDGGKYFNQANLDYVKKQKMAFANDDANNWKEYYQNKRSYTEYYDYHKEMQDLMKEFKPSTYKIDKINGLYKITDENASWTDAEIRKYLDANLSDKAKQQMRIEGDVKYNNDPKALGQIYMAQAQDKVSKYDAGIAFADKRLSSETDKDKIADLKQYKQTMQDRKTALNNTIQTIKAGDYTLIKKRGEEIAADLYTTETMGKITHGFSHDDITHKLTGDDVGLAIYSQNRQDARQERAFEQQKELARLKGEIAGPPQLTTLQTEDEETRTPEAMQQEANKYQEENASLDDVNRGMVLTWMQQKDPANKNLTIDKVTTDNMKDYMKHGFNGEALPAGHIFNINNTKIKDNTNASNIVLNKLNTIRGRVLDSYSDADKKEIKAIDDKVASLGTIILDDGSKITAKDLYKGMTNGSIKVEGGGWGLGATYDININGKKVTASRGGSADRNTDLVQAINTIKGVQKNPVYQKLNKDVTTYFDNHSKTMVNTADVMAFGEKSAERTALENEMSSIFPKATFDVQSAGIGSGVDNQGTAYFYITGKGENAPGKENVMANLLGRGYKDVVAHEIKGSGGVVMYEIKNYNSPVTQAYRQFNQSESLVVHDIMQNVSEGDLGRYESSGYFSKSNRQLKIVHDHGMYYIEVAGLNGGDDMARYDQPFTSPADAAMMGQQLTETLGGVAEARLKNYWHLKKIQ
jgi:hypothetical protein